MRIPVTRDAIGEDGLDRRPGHPRASGRRARRAARGRGAGGELLARAALRGANCVIEGRSGGGRGAGVSAGARVGPQIARVSQHLSERTKGVGSLADTMRCRGAHPSVAAAERAARDARSAPKLRAPGTRATTPGRPFPSVSSLRREAAPTRRGRRREPAYSGSRATAMSTRAPRKGTPSASSSARWRSPLASEPSARTTRCHGTVGVLAREEDRAGLARRAGRDVAVGAHEARRDRPHAVEDALGGGHRRDDRLSRDAEAGHLLDRRPRSAVRRARRGRAVALVRGRADRAVGASRAWGRWPRSRSPSRPTARARSTAWRRARAPARPSTSSWPTTSSRASGRSPWSTRTATWPPTPARAASPTPATRRATSSAPRPT